MNASSTDCKRAAKGAPGQAEARMLHALAPTVLIFGANGFIGQALTAHLRAAGHAVLAPRRAECDLLDAESVARTLDALPDGASLVHCASISRRQEESYAAFLKNIAMVEHVVLAAKPGRLRSVVYLSSTDVYGDGPACPITEDTPFAPSGYYGTSKLTCEKFWYHQGAMDCPVTSLRLPGIYGAGDKGGSMLGMFARRIAKGDGLTLFGDGSTLRDFVLVQDLCQLIERLLEQPWHGALNVATGRSTPLLEILHILARTLGRELSLTYAPPGPRSSHLIFDTTALARAVPGMAFTPITLGAPSLAEDLRREGLLPDPVATAVPPSETRAASRA